MTVPERIKLKPCPYCGGKPVAKVKKGTSRTSIPGFSGAQYFRGFVKCTGCGVTTPLAKSPSAMNEAWNRRAALSAALSEQTLPVRVALDDIVNDERLTREVAAFLLERDQQTTQDERDEAERETSAFMISQMVARHVRPALVDVPAVEPEPVAWLKLVKMTPIAGNEYCALWLADEADAKAFPVYAHPPVSALVNAQADADVVERWQPIETAPKDGSRVDLWADFQTSGPRRVTNAFWNSVKRCWQLGQFSATDYDVQPNVTHWMPPPTPPALSSLGSAGVGSATKSKGGDHGA